MSKFEVADLEDGIHLSDLRKCFNSNNNIMIIAQVAFWWKVLRCVSISPLNEQEIIPDRHAHGN